VVTTFDTLPVTMPTLHYHVISEFNTCLSELTVNRRFRQSDINTLKSEKKVPNFDPRGAQPLEPAGSAAGKLVGACDHQAVRGREKKSREKFWRKILSSFCFFKIADGLGKDGCIVVSISKQHVALMA
jgi:hypothetical protein